MSGPGQPGSGGFGQPPGGFGQPPGGGFGQPPGGGFGQPPGGGFGQPPGGFGQPPGGFGQPPGGGFGQPGGGGPPGGAPAGGKTDPWAIISLVAGIVSFLCCCCGLFGAPMPIAAIITGLVSMRRIANDPSLKGRGMAIAGVACGVGALLLMIIALVVNLLNGGGLGPQFDRYRDGHF